MSSFNHAQLKKLNSQGKAKTLFIQPDNIVHAITNTTGTIANNSDTNVLLNALRAAP
ncbi:hypothetical protein PSCICL_24040 [Pseudomonas cichorii]|nr:hypothetical protein PSCICL_24040 [Pseudomonas cichorii]